ncbi:hypothetical protein ASPBRDRAFT_209817 [Aspergillus brasiliensis CBS 101740]|uniref:BZIP domain-containing protein n=1 Tax=Aspergillus brasiliensis (strain CBS 101740 / IMI 381727 / IBT 21946) TaxID=767769 RepID=A0A1L9UA58_ASPBC|nr:hypothetical protein ASPBRDRAFT_209817 [Aspergillus brasiliensis CBS 101740]
MASSDRLDQSIILQQLPHQSYIKRQNEDWAGVTNPKERKRLQNRLNQRIWRQRKLKKGAKDGAAEGVTDAGKRGMNEQLTPTTAHQRRAMLERFALDALHNYMTNQPNTDQLMRVIQLNTINALTSNATALKLQVDWLVCHAISPFGFIGPAKAADLTASSTGPTSLIPTDLQRRIPHHPWIDLFPLARLRDSLLVATCVSDMLTDDDEEQLWADLVEWGGNGTEGAGLIVWGEPSDPRNWEATVPFLRRWGWLLQGCSEILEATNYWRQMRGERRLHF